MRTASLYYNSTSYWNTTFSYTTNGLLSCVTNANGHWAKFYYDQYGFPTSTVPQTGPTVNYQYSQLGHLTNISMPGDSGTRTTSLDVNEMGLLNSITYPDNSSETFAYDLAGNLTNHVDAGGRITRCTYLPTGKPESTILVLSDGSALTNRMDYDQQLNVIAIKDALSRVVEGYVLDIEDRPATITNIENQTMTVTYGVGGYINAISRYDETTVSNAYNGDGRITHIFFPDETNSFAYLKNGLLRTASGGAGTVSNAWDFANRLTSSEGVMTSGTVSYTYFPAGDISNMSSVAGDTTYSLDEAERVTAVDGPDSRFTFGYNTNNGLLASMTCTNTGVSVAYSYSDMDRVTAITWRDASSNIIRRFDYRYNTVGLITNETLESGQQMQYWYDDLDRLAGERRLHSSGEEIASTAYSYDNAGNRTNKTWGDVSIAYVLPYGSSGNRLTGWSATTSGAGVAKLDVAGHSSETIGTNPALGQLYVSNTVGRTAEANGTNYWAYDLPCGVGTQEIIAAVGDVAGNTGYATNTVIVRLFTNATYAYSSAGCLTNISYTGQDCSRTLDIAWNQKYQVASFSTNGAQAESYFYDALDRRVAIASGGTTNWLVYDDSSLIAEVDENGVLRKSYTWGGGKQLLSMTDHVTTNTYYFITDHKATVHAVLNSAGAVVESYRYDAWGRVLGVYGANGQPLAQSAIGNRHLFHGKEYSWAAALYYNYARWFDPITGRWLSNDPIGISGGLNQYVFCANNPVNFTDPFGLWNLWNSATWGIGSGSGVSIWRSLSPFDETAAWRATGHGALQGAAAWADGFNIFGNTFQSVYADACGNVEGMFRFSRGAGAFSFGATAIAGGAAAWQYFGGTTMNVALGPGRPFHVIYGSGGQWVHAAGSALGHLRVTAQGAAALANSSWFTVTGIPVLNSAGVLATGGTAWTCLTAAGRAFLRGWGL